MPTYSTGEMARLCNVTVRTVQYYDQRGILIPSGLSEGGRRLYSDEDLQKLKTICFLRNIGLSIDGISALLKEENAGSVIHILLEQHSQLLKNEIADRRKKLQAAEQLAQECKAWKDFSVKTLNDIAVSMKNQKKLRRVHLTMVIVGVFMDIIGLGSLLFGILKGSWLPFAICAPIVILCGVLLIRLYYQKTVYICPQCHTVFHPQLKQFLFSAHTPKARKLTCTKCGYKGFCVETYETSRAS